MEAHFRREVYNGVVVCSPGIRSCDPLIRDKLIRKK